MAGCAILGRLGARLDVKLSVLPLCFGGLLLFDGLMLSRIPQPWTITQVAQAQQHAEESQLEVSQYVGCFAAGAAEVEEAALPVEGLDVGATPETCDAACSGFLFFGLRHGQRCFCGNGPDLGVQVSDIECNESCRAQPLIFCGASWRSSVYRTSWYDEDPAEPLAPESEPGFFQEPPDLEWGSEFQGAFSDEVEEPSSADLEQWWAGQLLVKDVKGNHIENSFFPVNFSSPEIHMESPLGAAYTRAWRRSSILRLLSSWAALTAMLNLTYWLDAGSLLGLARSKGKSLIPWDFDADVGMLRDEFQKLNASLNQGGRPGLAKDLDFGLPGGIMLFTRQAPAGDGFDLASVRDDVIPGRIIDVATGFYMDIFSFIPRKDGGVQFFWPFSGPTHGCYSGQTRRLALVNDGPLEEAPPGDRQGAAENGWDEGDDDGDLLYRGPPWGDDELGRQYDYDDIGGGDDVECEAPCAGSQNCYVWGAGVILPTVPCSLDGINASLQCPHKREDYLLEQYGPSWSWPDHAWRSEAKDFLKH